MSTLRPPRCRDAKHRASAGEAATTSPAGRSNRPLAGAAYRRAASLARWSSGRTTNAASRRTAAPPGPARSGRPWTACWDTD